MAVKRRKKKHLQKPHTKQASAAHGARKSASEHAKDSFHIIVVALICLIFAVRMGALSPNFEFQRATEQMICAEGSCCTSSLLDVVASGNKLLLRASNLKNASVHAVFFWKREGRNSQAWLR